VTSTLTFQFTSPQFTFDSAQILFFKGGRLSSDGTMLLGEISDGSIDGVLVEGPIEFDAMLYAVRATRRDDNRTYEIACLRVSRAITERDISSGMVVVGLDLPLVLVIRVEDSSGAPVSGAMVNFSIPLMTATAEGPVNERGELLLFGTPGHYSVRLVSAGDRSFGPEGVWADFDVTPDEHGERVIVLRIPSTP